MISTRVRAAGASVTAKIAAADAVAGSLPRGPDPAGPASGSRIAVRPEARTPTLSYSRPIAAGFFSDNPRCAVPELLVTSNQALLKTVESFGLLPGAVKSVQTGRPDLPEAWSLGSFSKAQPTRLISGRVDLGFDTHARKTPPTTVGVCSMPFELYGQGQRHPRVVTTRISFGDYPSGRLVCHPEEGLNPRAADTKSRRKAGATRKESPLLGRGYRPAEGEPAALQLRG